MKGELKVMCALANGDIAYKISTDFGRRAVPLR